MNSNLFKKDVLARPCLYDTNTTNKSFIKMSMILKRMGVKNHKFMLTLYQEDLLGVDPFDPDLSKEMKMKIILEAKLTPWYAFREVIRIPESGSSKASMFRLNRANLAGLWLFFNSIDTFLTMPRQIGKTITYVALAVYNNYILAEQTDIGMFAKGSKLQGDNVKRLKNIRDALPEYMFENGFGSSSNNQESVEYFVSNTKYSSLVANPSKKVAFDQGRGSSFIWTHWDEFGYYTNNVLAWAAAIPATRIARARALENGIPCANVITTTAARIDTPEGAFAYELKSDAMRFNERVYDTEDIEALKALVKVNSKNGFMYLEYSYRQLGLTDEWFEECCVGLTKDKIDTEYLNRWISGTEKSIISRELLDRMEASTKEPVHISVENGLVLNWYVAESVITTPEIMNIPFIIGSDNGDQVGDDFTTLVMLNPKDMAVVMTTRCNTENVMFVIDTILHLLKRFPRSLYVPERNRAAQILDIIIHRMVHEEHMDPLRRIYNTYVNDKGDVSGVDLDDGGKRKKFGFYTSANSRHVLYSKVLMTAVNANAANMQDKTLVSEIAGLVVKNGRIDHQSSGHDDTVIAYLLGIWFVLFAKNIGMYGIHEHEIMETTEDGKVESNVSIVELKRKIKQIKEALSHTTSLMMQTAYTQELTVLTRQLNALTSSSPAEIRVSIHQHDETAEIKPKFSLDMFRATAGGFM